MRRTRFWGAVALGFLAITGFFPRSANAFPAFARKYGLRCTACHEAWPVLSDFGRAFRDNGYQIGVGKDDPVTTDSSYFPIAVRLTPHYEFNTVSAQPTDQGTKTLASGGFAAIGIDLLMGGTLDDNVSFLVVPTGFTPDDGIDLESAWVRFDNLAGSSWLNVKIGKHEVDLPRSSHRPWNLSDTGFLIYGFHPPGSISAYDLGANQRGIEAMGHDKGSLTRVAFSVFNVNDSPGSRNAMDTPGAYFHAAREWQVDADILSAVRAGVFASMTTWPTNSLTDAGAPIPGGGSGLKRSDKYGGEAQFWLGPPATPIHLILVAARGRDDKALVPGATRDGEFQGGFFELGCTPALKTTVFGRYDDVRSVVQAIPGTPDDSGDQRALTFGLRQTLHYSNRTEYALHLEYTSLTIRRAAVDGSDVTSTTAFAGIDFAY